MAFELKIKTDLSNLPKIVETNIDEVQPLIKAAIERTKGLEVTDNRDEIVAADEDASKLTKMKQAISRFRIDHMALWAKPMEDFEKKCKAAEKSLDEAATEIKTKTGEVKELWRNRKKDECGKLWNNILTDAFGNDAEIVKAAEGGAFWQLWTNPKTKGTWLNSSVKLQPTINDAMTAEVERMKQVIAAVETNYANDSEEVRAKARLAMLVKFDLADVVTAVTSWKAQEAEIAKRAEAERQAKADLAAKRAASGQGAPVSAVKPTPTPTKVEPKAEPAPKKLETYRLAITGTREDLAALKAWGIAHGITFTNLDK